MLASLCNGFLQHWTMVTKSMELSNYLFHSLPLQCWALRVVFLRLFKSWTFKLCLNIRMFHPCKKIIIEKLMLHTSKILYVLQFNAHFVDNLKHILIKTNFNLYMQVFGKLWRKYLENVVTFRAVTFTCDRRCTESYKACVSGEAIYCSLMILTYTKMGSDECDTEKKVV